MRRQHPFSIVHIHPYVLLGLGGGLSAIHLTLLGRFAHSNQFSNSLLLWAAIAGLVQQNWNDQKRGSSYSACVSGGILLLGVLLKVGTLSSYDPFLRLYPLLVMLSLALLHTGWKGVCRYWREIIAWAVLSVPPSLIFRLIDPSILTAKIATFLLWYLGWSVSRQGSEIILPTGTIAVLSGCAGLESILQLLGLSALLILFFLPRWIKSSLAIGGAIVIAILTNSARVALMAVLNAEVGQSSFEYWHYGNGSHLFSLLAVSLFVAFCWVLLQQGKTSSQR